MQLSRLTISFTEYGVNKGRYVGEAQFSNQYGQVTVVMSPDMSDEVLKICASALVKNTQDLAQNLTAATLTQVSSPAIEHKD